ncbi:hypothetical protein [Photobacterium damselae]|uniref:hypothetical protein n=1 Tax=Photobacterium damselae TaxID=38293 RepID=UPI0015E62C68|nr:hypothetical protein [Photobacterium damselae]
MLLLKKPEIDELDVITQVRSVCCNCTVEITIPVPTKDAAAIQLQRLGWRAYETDDETGANVCPDCVKGLLLIEEEEKQRNDGKWCDTMDRLKSECGCPDCGGSLLG